MQYAAQTDSFWNSYSKVTPIQRKTAEGLPFAQKRKKKVN